MKMHLHGPMDYAKKLKLRFRVEDLDLLQKDERHLPVVRRRRTRMHIFARVAQQYRVGLT